MACHNSLNAFVAMQCKLQRRFAITSPQSSYLREIWISVVLCRVPGSLVCQTLASQIDGSRYLEMLQSDSREQVLHALPSDPFMNHWSFYGVAVISNMQISSLFEGLVDWTYPLELFSNYCLRMWLTKSAFIHLMSLCHQSTNRYLHRCKPHSMTP